MIRAALGRALETGALDGRLARAAARFWAGHADVVRPLVLPHGAAVIGVGGSTLGGSHKTPVALALAAALRGRGEALHVVGHGYRARVPCARAVHRGDSARTVGDDAAWLADELRGAGVSVFVGDRGAALRLAAANATVVIVDGLLQARPRRLSLSLLAVDATDPWGAGACPPAGDLRAAPEALLAAADAVVAVHPGIVVERSDALHDASSWVGMAPAELARLTACRPVFAVGARLGATLVEGGRALSLASLAGTRVGVVLAIARPERVLRCLSASGIHPVATRLFADHARPRARGLGLRDAVDVWLTTPKCATKLGAHFEGANVVVLRRELSLPDGLLALCTAAARAPDGPS